MPDAAERAKYAAEEKAIRDKWMRQNPQASQPKPQVSREPGGKSAVKGEMPQDRKFVLPEPEPLKVQENLPKPTPYMAMAVDKNGAPIYGEGLKGWARKAWADLTDPMKYFQDQKKLSQEVQDRITKEYEAGRTQAGKVIEDKFKWSQWGQKIFGITSEELGAIAPLGKAERAIATEAGDSVAGTAVARTARIALDTTQNFVWGGLAILGMGDQVMRKLHATTQGMDAVADRFNKDEPDTLVKKVVQNSALGLVKDTATVANAIKDGRLKWSDTKEVIDQYKAGSEMVYSMMFADGARAEFEKGLAEGRDPVVMAQDLGAIGIELAGSIMGDPTTYLGLSLVRPVNVFSLAGRESGDVISILGKTRRLPWKTVVRIPEFGEIIGATVGKARIAAEARFVANAVPELEKSLEAASKATGDLETAMLANKAVQDVLKHYSSGNTRTLEKSVIGKGANEIKVMGVKLWNMFSLDTESKVNVIARDANAWMSRLIESENGMDNSYMVLRDMVALRRGGDGAEEAARRLITKGNHVFSPVGEMVGDILAKLEDEKIFDLVVKYGDDQTELHTQLTQNISKIVQDYVPSVGEMHDAAARAKELVATGAEVPERVARFAKMYDDVPPMVKKITQIVKTPMAIQSKTSAVMVSMFMQFVPRSWSRNIQGAFIPMASRIGLAQAFEVATGAVAGLNKTVSDRLLSKLDAQIIDMVDFVPSAEGISRMTGKKQIFGGAGMLESIKRSEEDMARGIEVAAIRDHIQKSLQAVVKDVPEYENLVASLPKEAQSLVFAAFQRADGNTTKMQGILQKWIGTGEIPMKDIIDLPPKLKTNLQQYTDGMLEAIEDARATSKTSTEFKERVQKLTEVWDAHVTKAYNDQPTLSKAFAEKDTFGQQVAELAPEVQREAIVGLYTAWHNVQNQLDTITETLNQNVGRKLDDMARAGMNGDTTASQKWDELKPIYEKVMKDIRGTKAMTEEAWKRVDSIRQPLVRDIKSAREVDIPDLWQTEYEAGGYKFILANLYPDADLSTMSLTSFKSLAWQGYFEFASDAHKVANVSRHDAVMNSYEELAKGFGSTLDELAGSNSSGQNVFALLNEHYADAQKYQELHAWERFYNAMKFQKIDESTFTLRQAAEQYKAAHPTWDADIDLFMKDINKESTASTQIAQLARNLNIPTSWRNPGDMDKSLLKKINEQLQKQADEVDVTAGKVKKTKDIFRYISKNGGMNPAVFKEIMGDTIGKQKMIPGLTNKKAKGIDELGIKLWEGGFITREQADDYAFITDFVRNFKQAEIPDDARIAAEQASRFVPYERLQDVHPDTAERALKAYASERGIKPLPVKPVEKVTNAAKVEDIIDPNAPYYNEAGELVDPTLEQARAAFRIRIGRPMQDSIITQPDAMKNMLKGMKSDLGKWTKTVANEWGMTTKVAPSDDFKTLFKDFERAIKPRMDHVKLEAAITGISTRNFVLHDYNKTYADHMLSMFLGNSFHYWTTRTYSRALESILENPKYANMYMRYKEYNKKRHADQPEWYRQNIQIDSVFGIQLENPYFMNLESAINPMYGLTGVDFNDPRKRVDWMSRAVDDMNKLGPTFSPLISWGIGLAMFNKGEEEAGQRWFGRMLPQTALIKEATSKYLGKAIELDPFVKFLEGGVDPYERNRVAAALANMVAAGEITQEQMIEAARTKEGDVWEAGIEAAATARFGSSATSFFFGAGLKPRTQQDMLLEKFWQDYSTMVSSSSMMTPEQYRQSWDNMRDNEDYGMFMDALLLSRKSGAAMESAYAYNVFSRVPPGELNGILETVGIRPDLVQAFYDNKGDFSKMNLLPQDKERFMAGAIDIGAILALPDNATREEWGAAKDQYKLMNTELQKQFGEGILDLMSDYYSAPERDVFLDDNPDVRAAMELKDAYVLNNPRLMQYYGGISTMERYYKTIMERDLAKVYGSDIREIETEYYDLLTTQEQKAFKKEHPELKKYWEDKKIYQDKLDRRIVVFGSNLKPTPRPVVRLNAELPSNPNVPQKNLYAITEGQNQRSAEEWTQELGQPMMSLIVDYWNGEKLPSPVRSQLDFKARKYGAYDGDQLLQMILMSLQ